VKGHWPEPGPRGAAPRRASARRRALAVGLVAVLAGCATPPRIGVAFVDAAAADARFELAGRLSAKHGDNAVAASFRWTHAPDADLLVLSTPLGQGLARLSGSVDGVVLELADGAVARAGDWEALTREALGVPVPVRGLASWVRGRPHPASPSTLERDASGRVLLLRQDGWEILYGYRDDGPQPSRLVLAYPDIEIRLAIDERAGAGGTSR
jgi:outer membrane lipoprotein LolB